MKIKLTTKLIIVIITILCLSLILLTILNFFKFKKNYKKLFNSRMRLHAEKLQKTVEKGLDLGVNLSEMKNLDGNLKNIIENEKSIKNIIVFDKKDEIILSCFPEKYRYKTLNSVIVQETEKRNFYYKIYKKSLKEKIQFINKNNYYVFRLFKMEIAFNLPEKEKIILIPLKNNFNLRIGVIYMEYSLEELNKNILNTLKYQLKNAGMFFLIFLIITIFSIRFLCNKLRNSFDYIENTSNKLLNDEINDTDINLNNTEIENYFYEFGNKYVELNNKLMEINEIMERTDADD